MRTGGHNSSNATPKGRTALSIHAHGPLCLGPGRLRIILRPDADAPPMSAMARPLPSSALAGLPEMRLGVGSAGAMPVVSIGPGLRNRTSHRKY